MKKQLLHKFLLLLFVVVVALANCSKTFAASLPSRMCIDTPTLNQVIDNKSFSISGWALNSSGIKEIKIYIDGSLRGKATYGLSRPDVDKSFKGYKNGNKSGFTYYVDANTISSGKHKISVYAYGYDGTSQNKDSYITVLKKDPHMCIDTPSTSLINGTSCNIAGWSLNPSGVKAVQIYIDGKLMGNAKYGLLRNDVNAAFPGYPNGKLSGFSYSLNVTNISSGKHKLTVSSIGKDGSKQSIDRDVTVSKKPSLMYIDYPTSNYCTTGQNLTISGWTLNASGIKSIRYYLNDKLIGTSVAGIKRPDVNAAFPGYINGSTSGFKFSFNVMKYVSPGTKNVTLKVISTGNDGTSSTITRTLILKKLSEKIYIDTPKSNYTFKNDISVSGWSLNASGVKSVKVYLDGVFKGNAAYGTYRPDVNSAYPGYTDSAKSGFQYTLKASILSTGEHTLRVDSIGNDGRIASQSIKFKFQGVISYESYDYTLDYMTKVQVNTGAVYQNTTTWTWDTANYNMIKKYLDVENILNDSYAKYEFLKLSYNDGISISDLNAILNNKGILTNKGQSFYKYAKANNVNPIYLVSHALLETGNGTSNLANGILVTSVDGKPVTPKKVYNFFGIGAYDSNPDKYGSEYAYKQGWFTVDAAINGGAAFISKGYINSSSNQDTLYKMRWNPKAPGTHQYATDVKWAYNQVYNIKNLIDKCTKSILYFKIPVFKK